MSERQIVFRDYHEVALDAGEYRLEVAHRATLREETPGSARKVPLGTSSLVFSVAAPRFRLGPEDVAAVFPAAGADGAFAGALPHVILARDTLPWERSADAQEGRPPQPPWLALLLFTDAEWAGIQIPARVQTVAQLHAATDATHPTLVPEPTQHADDPVDLIDVPADLAARVCPRSAELRWLTHVRVTDGRAQALVVGSRPIDPGEAPGGFVACLVSLEARWKDIDPAVGGPLPTETGKRVRFVVLKRWRFSSQAEAPELHTTLATMCTGAELALRRSAPPGADPELATRLADGFVAIPHHLRDGSRSLAWYRGPLAPIDAALPEPTVMPDVRDPDELCSVDAARGIFDLSYAAAWQLGRQLALGDPEYALRLLRWKRRHRGQLALLRQQVDHWHVPHRPDHHHPSPLVGDADAAWLLGDSLLGRLGRLEGVPWRYLVADEALLPLERRGDDPLQAAAGCFRAFAVDPWWVECLRDGAFSIGRVHAADVESEKALREAHDLLAAPRMFGFLMRGPAVQAWPHLEAEALLPGVTAPLAPLRMVRPRPDVLLALFTLDDVTDADLRPTAFVLHQPHETMHFGLDREGRRWRRRVRDPVTGAPLGDKSVDVPMRGGVVDVLALVGKIDEVLPGDGLTPHTLALALFDAPDRVTIHLPRGGA